MQAPGAPSQKPSAPIEHANGPAQLSITATSGNSAQKSAALKGAALAFHGQKTDGDKPKPLPRAANPVTTTTAPAATISNNGALRAATQASREHGLGLAATGAGAGARSPQTTARPHVGNSVRPGVSRQTTGGSVDETGRFAREGEHGVVAQRLTQPVPASAASVDASLAHGNGNANGNSKSVSGPKPASLIAAMLAASRSASPSSNQQHAVQGPTSTLTPTQVHSRVLRRADSDPDAVSSTPASLELLDTASIPSTNTLVSMFETKEGGADPRKKLGSPNTRRRSLPKLRPPTPPRSLSPRLRAESGVSLRESRQEKPAVEPKPPLQITSGHIISTASDGAVGPSSPHRRSQKDVGPQGAAGREPAPASTSASAPAPKPKPLAGDAPAASPRESRRVQSMGSLTAPSAPSARKLVPLTPPKAGAGGTAFKNPPIVRRAVTEVVSPQPKRIITPSGLAPALEKPKLDTGTDTGTGTGTGTGTKHTSGQEVSKTSVDTRDASNLPEMKPNHRSSLTLSDASSDDSFVSASSIQSPEPPGPVSSAGDDDTRPVPDGPPLRKSTPVCPALQRRASDVLGTSSSVKHPPSLAHGRRPSTLSSPSSKLGLDSLANAILAGNIASSRNPSAVSASRSPAPPPPAPPPRRHGIGLLRPSLTGENAPGRRSSGHAAPRPGGTMLATLRAPTTTLSDDEDARRRQYKRRHLHKGGKHAHNEGSRRRWREEVTPRERRRYEAVWASNRGLFLRPGFAFQHPDHWHPPPAARIADGAVGPTLTQTDLSRAWEGPEADLVANVVARDIWSRSRLPVDELAEVWDLVDRAGVGALGKTEFVVGMWLIDQRLRGRKIPARVSESVWESARGGARVNIHVSGRKGK